MKLIRCFKHEGRKNNQEGSSKKEIDSDKLMGKLEAYFPSEGEKIFFKLLDNKLRESREKADYNKRKAWSPFRLFFVFLKTVVALPVLSAMIAAIAKWRIDQPDSMHALVMGMLEDVRKYPFLWMVLFLCGILLFLLSFYSYLFDKRSYKETWVRHRLNASRLELLIVHFLSNGDYSDEAKTRFRSQVFNQLGDNLKKFEKNMGKNETRDADVKFR